MTKTEAIKAFFQNEARPVSTKELTELKKADPWGFDELGEAALAALAQTA